VVALEEKDDELYSRGTCDMKGYLARCLAMVPDRRGRKLKLPFDLAFCYDRRSAAAACGR
jgi:acetylornithine deacetylase